MTGFFEDKKEEEQEVEKIKVGETEFTVDELNDLVGSGKKLKEIEKKQGQPIDEVLESWGKRGERLGEWKKVTGAKSADEFIKLKEKMEADKNRPPEEIDKEKLKQQVLDEARNYGLLTKEEASKMFEDYYKTQRAGERIYAQTNKVISRNAKAGNPATTAEELLKFMADPANPKDPEKAYKLMFEKEIDEIKQRKLESIKKPGMFTQQSGGEKNFEPKKVTKENLKSTLMEHFRGGGE